MSGRIQGVTRTALWQAWKVIRKELRRSSMRDVIDFLEYDIDPDKWINALLRDISAGTYEPRAPQRFTLAKSNGFSRVMTLPSVPDIVLYRAVVDHLYAKSRRRQHKHVYFEQQDLTQAQTAAAAAAKSTMSAAAHYSTWGASRFLAWLAYDQYRRYLIFSKVHDYIVTTDITNFFDSILYERVRSSLNEIAAPPRMIELLFFILERLSVRGEFGEAPRVGLPVDEFDCSRKLAHMVLFPHDERMVGKVGEDAYLRWMDDQDFGASSRAEGLRVLEEVGASLRALHLTPNAGKSKVMSLAQARRHFHLDLNKRLDRLDAMPRATGPERRKLAAAVSSVWKLARKHDGKGQWIKILKRLYRLAGLSRKRAFRRYAEKDALGYPQLAQRICDYMRCVGTGSEYLDFVEAMLGNPEQVYPDIDAILIESLLRVEATGKVANRARLIAAEVLRSKQWRGQHHLSAATAPLVILRFGDRRSLPTLRKFFADDTLRVPPRIARAAAVVYASYGPTEFNEVRAAASTLWKNYLADVVRMIDRLRSSQAVPVRFKARLAARVDSVQGQEYVDMRAVVSMRLLRLNTHAGVRSWLQSKVAELRKRRISAYDGTLLTRLVR